MYRIISESNSVRLFKTNYDDEYRIAQLNKFLNRNSNHWKSRIEKVFEMISNLDIHGKKVLDLGTSIGTYAFEFAQRGYEVYAIDLDEKSIDIAKKIANENNLKIDYRVADVSDSTVYPDNYFDLIYAGDIIEHLTDSVLDKTIANCYRMLKRGGYLIFHTTPLRYNRIFYHKRFPFWIILIPFAIIPDRYFKKLVQKYESILNLIRKIIFGNSFKEIDQFSIHCNLQTADSIRTLIKRNKLFIIRLDINIMEERFKRGVKFFIFRKKEYFQKDIFGVAKK